MVDWIVTAAMVMVCAMLMQHLGLAERLAELVGEVAKCYKCCTFWCCVVSLSVLGSDWFIAVVLSIIMSYLSHYFALLMIVLQKIYDKLWEKINK